MAVTSKAGQPGKPRMYVASPFGFAEGTKHWYDHVLLPHLEQHVQVLDPWNVDVSHIFPAPHDQRPALWLDLGDHHYDTIRDRAELVLALLDGEPPDNGTVCEAVWAMAHGKPVIGYRNDVRTAGEEGLPFNLMIGAAIRRSGGEMVSSLAELMEILPQFIARMSSPGR